MKKIRLDNLKIRHFRWILVVVAVVLVIVWILFYWATGEKAEQVMVERVKIQELTLARSGALSISEFFKERETELLLLSEMESIKAAREKEGREEMQLLVEQLRDKPITGIIRVDEKGIALWIINIKNERRGEGVSLADRDYFIWASQQKEPGKVFIAKPVIARGGIEMGELVVVMATPVFYQDEFNGIVFIAFLLEGLTEKYVTPLAFSSKVESFIIAQDGDVVSSTIPEARGKNVFEHIQTEEGEEKEEYLAMATEALAGKEGGLVHYYHQSFPVDRQIKVITAYAPIKTGSQIWSLWISTPYDEAVRLVLPLRFNQIQWLIFGLMGLIILILVFVFGVRIAQRDAFVDGFRDGRNGVKKAKKKS